MTRIRQTRTEAGEAENRYEIIGGADIHALEALCLEIRQLARRHGVTVEELRVETVRPRDRPSA
jgi:hypothetical protein